jgi:hypothetical protein
MCLSKCSPELPQLLLLLLQLSLQLLHLACMLLLTLLPLLLARLELPLQALPRGFDLCHSSLCSSSL